jgi:hypothetical protein
MCVATPRCGRGPRAWNIIRQRSEAARGASACLSHRSSLEKSSSIGKKGARKRDKAYEKASEKVAAFDQPRAGEMVRQACAVVESSSAGQAVLLLMSCRRLRPGCGLPTDRSSSRKRNPNVKNRNRAAARSCVRAGISQMARRQTNSVAAAAVRCNRSREKKKVTGFDRRLRSSDGDGAENPARIAARHPAFDSIPAAGRGGGKNSRPGARSVYASRHHQSSRLGPPHRPERPARLPAAVEVGLINCAEPRRHRAGVDITKRVRHISGGAD